MSDESSPGQGREVSADHELSSSVKKEVIKDLHLFGRERPCVTSLSSETKSPSKNEDLGAIFPVKKNLLSEFDRATSRREQEETASELSRRARISYRLDRQEEAINYPPAKEEYSTSNSSRESDLLLSVPFPPMEPEPWSFRAKPTEVPSIVSIKIPEASNKSETYLRNAKHFVCLPSSLKDQWFVPPPPIPNNENCAPSRLVRASSFSPLHSPKSRPNFTVVEHKKPWREPSRSPLAKRSPAKTSVTIRLDSNRPSRPGPEPAPLSFSSYFAALERSRNE